MSLLVWLAVSAQNQEAGSLRIMMLVTGLILLAPMTYIIAPARTPLVQSVTLQIYILTFKVRQHST